MNLCLKIQSPLSFSRSKVIWGAWGVLILRYFFHFYPLCEYYVPWFAFVASITEHKTTHSLIMWYISWFFLATSESFCTKICEVQSKSYLFLDSFSQICIRTVLWNTLFFKNAPEWSLVLCNYHHFYNPSPFEEMIGKSPESPKKRQKWSNFDDVTETENFFLRDRGKDQLVLINF